MNNFPQKSGAKTLEPFLQLDNNWSKFKRGSKDSFFLHDGPPYANGEVHLGHAVNKVLKDFILRYKESQGKSVYFVPGHDTHGLPVETSAKKKNKNFENLSTQEKRNQCQLLATENLKKQQQSFKRLGVKGDYENPYVTMLPEYESAQLEAFGELYFQGYLYRGYQPVWYSPSSKSVLANAELEHQEREGFSVFFLFPLKDSRYNLVVWTTQPWTLYGNQAVAVNPASTYRKLTVKNLETDTYFDLVVGADCLTDFVNRVSSRYEVKQYGDKVNPSDLDGLQYYSPLNNQYNHVVCHETVNPLVGTGLLHVCPAHGLEDWELGKQFNLPVENLLDESGKLYGLNPLLEKFSALLHLDCYSKAFLVEPLQHKYPFDWRTKKPVVMMPKLQWFFDLNKVKKLSGEALKSVEWDSPSSQKRFTSMLENREVWPVSRQRTWGLPLPFFYHKETGEHLLTEETLSHLVSLVKTYGSNAWWEFATKDLLPDSMKHLADSYETGQDTMDVWLDSGLSWYCVNKTHGVPVQADVYLEGSDQHRGWFQSSFLTSVALTGKAPFKKLVTHGFVLDKKNQKMSKSVGNVVDPMQVVDKYSADVFRLWVAGTDYQKDMSFSEAGMDTAFSQYKELRGFFRFAYNNLFDLDRKTLTSLKTSFYSAEYVDKQVDVKVAKDLVLLKLEVDKAYEEMNFSKALKLVENSRANLSANWLMTETTGLKERLYRHYPDTKGNAEDPERRYGQYMLYMTLKAYMKLLYPVLPHLVTEMQGYLQRLEADRDE